MTITTNERQLVASAALGVQLHSLMWQRKVTQAAAGEALGKTQTVVGKKLRGEVPITIDELMVLAGLVQADPAALLTEALRACRDSNPKPSVLCFGVRTSLTPDRRDLFGLCA